MQALDFFWFLRAGEIDVVRVVVITQMMMRDDDHQYSNQLVETSRSISNTDNVDIEILLQHIVAMPRVDDADSDSIMAIIQPFAALDGGYMPRRIDSIIAPSRCHHRDAAPGPERARSRILGLRTLEKSPVALVP